MSSEVVIDCEAVSKAYQIYRKRTDRLMQVVLGWHHPYYKRHWVLRGIDFRVTRGEAVGIIGRNGSGKTTLLQLVCGITAPTAGRLTVNGRIAPVLSLGAGFDHELTGRENVVIGGALLGVRRRIIEERIAAIRDFAGLGAFFDLPVKLYSTGMAARLAFALCAHSDADILLIDEALSVGDEAFRHKCTAFMAEFRKRGTLIVVSHGLLEIRELCDRVIWIDRGTIRMSGDPELVTAAYVADQGEGTDDDERFALESS